MSKKLSLSEINVILEHGDFTKLLGTIEDNKLECKKTIYHLDDEYQKRELAKDVSAFANGSGGLILLGVETFKNPVHSGDEIKAIHSFPHAQIDEGRYSDVLRKWIYPPVKNVEIKWYPSVNNASEGIVTIAIPQQIISQQPFLITKSVESSSKSNKVKVTEVLFGYAERTRDEAVPITVQEIQARLKDGIHFSSLNDQLEGIQETLHGFKSAQVSPSSERSIDELLDERIGLVLSELDLDVSAPTYILSVAPIQPIQIPSLFASKEAPIVRLLENPPKIRPSGFDLDTGGRAARIVGGTRRRSLEPKFRTINLWQDGTLIFAEEADSVCWRPIEKKGVPLRINQLALVETTYLFAELSKLVFKEASRHPRSVLYRLELRNMTVDGVPCGLVPGVVGDNNWRFGRDIHRAADSKIRVELKWELDPIDPGKVAYRLISLVYQQFAMEHDQVPYKVNLDDDPAISPEEIKRLSRS